MKEKKNEGITLIALVITIIVLLILAGVTLSTLFGNNGILTESKFAVEANKEANAKEQVQLAWTACETEYQAAWTKDSSVVKEGYFKVENLNKNLGTGTVKSVGYVESGKSTVTYTLDGTEYEFEIANGQVYKVGQAPDVTEPMPEEPQEPGTLVKTVTKDNYGETINYSANGVDDWKIFYTDEENVFIIASDCLAEDKIPTISTMTKNGNKVYWNDNVKNNIGAAGISAEVAKKYKLSWLENHTESNKKNMQAIEDLLNTSFWTEYAKGVVGAEAIGGPTLEMWIASWNAKYPSRKLFYNAGGDQNSDGSQYYDNLEQESFGARNNGYLVGPTTTSKGGSEEDKEIDGEWVRNYGQVGTDVGFVGSKQEAFVDELFFPGMTVSNGAIITSNNPYWLASPAGYAYYSYDKGDSLFVCASDTWYYPDYSVSWQAATWRILTSYDASSQFSSDYGMGIRPVVKLPTSLNAHKEGSKWVIDK